ncbi:MAG: VUT family protein [Myxococcales bacterium]|jgi:uncharacterized integral membrane protein (TIGR00697 family)|nr:MAG: VUT family protein [Myxococcales bacterium]
MFVTTAADPSRARLVEKRREHVFLLLSGLFLGTLAMLNLLGVTRFLDLSFRLPLIGVEVPMLIAVGVLPYPVTFLCTDFLSEFYGHRRANAVVFVGLLINLWVIFFLWLGGVLPGVADEANGEVFFAVRRLAFGTIAASMIAYLAAQFVDVWLFHFWKRFTAGRHLWLRNNGSTMVSQIVDTTAVILITHYWANALPIDTARALAPQLAVYIGSGYVFKVVIAALDTIPFYAGVAWLSEYLEIDPLHIDSAS